MWDWLYTEVTHADGTVTEKMRTTEAEWQQAQDQYQDLSAWEERKKLAKFMTDTYDSFFVNKGNHIALANRVATLYMDTSGTEVK